MNRTGCEGKGGGPAERYRLKWTGLDMNGQAGIGMAEEGWNELGNCGRDRLNWIGAARTGCDWTGEARSG